MLLTAAVLLLGGGGAWLARPTAAHAQQGEEGGNAGKTLRGIVRDAETGRPLPSAHVFVEGTRRGTVTNAEGRYRLRVGALPATVVVRFVGYEEARLRVTADTPPEEQRDGAGYSVALAPVTTGLEGVTVTAAGRASGADIMRRVIAAKQERRGRLRTFAAEAYNRFVVRNDTGIVSVAESLTQFFWDKEKGVREVVRSQRQTENLGLGAVLPAGLFVTNLYDDNVTVGGYRLRGVTHPEALAAYRFRIDTVRALGERAVFDIAVEPRGRFRSAFTGRLSVLDEAYALLEAELRPARSFLFPPPIRDLEITYRQQFSDFGKDFWLPISLRSEARAEVALPLLLDFPAFRIEQVSRLSGYQINVPLPDSLYAGEEAAVRATGLGSDTSSDSLIAAESAAVVPLSTEEARAVRTIDSTQTLEEAFAPSGPLARLLELSASVNGEEPASTGGDGAEEEAAPGGNAESGGLPLGLPLEAGVRPRLWFNRVEGGHVGARATLRLDGRALPPLLQKPSPTLSAEAGYQTARSAWTYGAGVEASLPAGVRLEASYRYGVDPRYRSRVYNIAGSGGRLANSLNMLRGGADYFDYYGTERWRVRLARGFSLPALGGGSEDEGGTGGGSNARLHVGLRVERAFAVERNTSYDLFGRSNEQPPNPAVEEQALRSLTAGLTLGGSSVGARLGVTGGRRLALAAEWAPEGFLGSEADFVHLQGTLDYRWEPFLRRRLLPMTLDVRLSGGTFAGGALPLQRFTIVEAPLSVVGPFGTLRTLHGDARPYQGEQHLAAFWEHNLRTAPFEAVGLYGLARRGWNVLLFGGHAMVRATRSTWIGEARQGRRAAPAGTPFKAPDGFHHEVGIGLSGLLGLVRVDLAKRLDAGGWAVSLGLARLF